MQYVYRYTIVEAPTAQHAFMQAKREAYYKLVQEHDDFTKTMREAGRYTKHAPSPPLTISSSTGTLLDASGFRECTADETLSMFDTLMKSKQDSGSNVYVRRLRGLEYEVFGWIKQEY